MRKTPTPKPQKVNFVLIPPESNGKEAQPYKLMRELVNKHHSQLTQAKIALAWRKGFKKDKDGHLTLGKCVKASALQRELVEYDFVILLNKEVWEAIEFTQEKKLALLDHELCHAEEATDKEGEPRYDERGRKLYRVRKHDIEEFRAVVERHGLYKHDLEDFARVLLRDKKMPLLAEMEANSKKRQEAKGDAAVQ